MAIVDPVIHEGGEAAKIQEIIDALNGRLTLQDNFLPEGDAGAVATSQGLSTAPAWLSADEDAGAHDHLPYTPLDADELLSGVVPADRIVGEYPLLEITGLNLPDPLDVPGGGTGRQTLEVNAMLMGQAASPISWVSHPGDQDYFLVSTTESWEARVLGVGDLPAHAHALDSASITGILPTVKGGTNNNFSGAGEDYFLVYTTIGSDQIIESAYRGTSFLGTGWPATISITGTNGLTGGGTLASSRTIEIDAPLQDNYGGTGNAGVYTDLEILYWTEAGGAIASCGYTVNDFLTNLPSHDIAGAAHTGTLSTAKGGTAVNMLSAFTGDLFLVYDDILDEVAESTKGVNSTFAPIGHGLVSAYHTAAGLTIGHFLKATAADAFAFAAHGLTYTDVNAAAAQHGIDTSHTGLLSTPKGGTGNSTWEATSATWDKIVEINSDGTALVSSGYEASDFLAVGSHGYNDALHTGTLSVDNGGTGSTSAGFVAGKFLAYNGSVIDDTAYDQNSFAAASHTHPASDITAATFASGTFVFQGEVRPSASGGDLGSSGYQWDVYARDAVLAREGTHIPYDDGTKTVDFDVNGTLGNVHKVVVNAANVDMSINIAVGVPLIISVKINSTYNTTFGIDAGTDSISWGDAGTPTYVGAGTVSNFYFVKFSGTVVYAHLLTYGATAW